MITSRHTRLIAMLAAVGVVVPEGHTLSAWITFSAHRDGDVTIKLNDRFWR